MLARIVLTSQILDSRINQYRVYEDGEVPSVSKWRTLFLYIHLTDRFQTVDILHE